MKLWKLVASRTGKLVARWMPAHADVKVHLWTKYTLTVQDVFGNCCADKMAGRAAEKCQVDPDSAKETLATLSLLQVVQRRLVAVLQFVASSSSHALLDCPLRSVRVPLSERIGRSPHQVVLQQHEAFCACCLSSCRRVPYPEFYAWLHSYCEGARVDPALCLVANRPQVVSRRLIAWSAGCRLHASHRLAQYRGVTWCLRCGYYTGTQVCKLRLPCPPAPTKKGLENASRLRRGLRPFKMKHWPEADALSSVQFDFA